MNSYVITKAYLSVRKSLVHVPLRSFILDDDVPVCDLILMVVERPYCVVLRCRAGHASSTVWQPLQTSAPQTLEKDTGNTNYFF